MRRVVVTGLSAITPLGSTAQQSWMRLIDGRSGITVIPPSLFDTSDLPTKIAGLIPEGLENGLNIGDYLSHKDLKKFDRFIHLGIAAAAQAIQDAGWVANSIEDAYETGVIIGSGIGGLSTIADNAVILEQRGPRKISPFFIPASLINLISGAVSIKYNFKGPNHAVATACSTGAHAIGDAARIIACGEAKVMIAGGSESAVSRLGIAGFNACRALSTNFNNIPSEASRPWDNDRDGFVMGEGAGVLVLEEYEHAKQRNAKIYAEIVGCGYTGDAYHITSPSEDGEGAFRAMEKALKKAQLNPNEIGYINAHGTSTLQGDMVELGAMKRLFNDSINEISISSTKSAIGHLLGASGSVEAVFSILALKHSTLPPTLNLHNPSKGCENIDLVPLYAKQKTLNYVMSNSFGFGGTNVSLIFKNV